jgi:hypothetical protein
VSDLPPATREALATAFNEDTLGEHAFELPAQTDVPLHLSGNLLWGVLCQCPEAPSCCVGPGGDTGPQGLDTDLANPDPTPRSGVLAIWRSDEACGDYTVSLGP